MQDKLNRYLWSIEKMIGVIVCIGQIENKISVILNLRQLIRKTAQLKVRFKKYQLRLFIRDIFDLVAVYETFELGQYRFLFDKISEKTTFIDIGAYNGDSALYALINIPRVKRIIAVEPLPDNFHALRENIKLNHARGTKLINAAIAKDYETKNLYLYPNKRQAGFLHLPYSNGVIRVPTIPFKALLRERFRGDVVVKCDAEGAEYEIFKNTPTRDLKKIKRLIFEYHFGGLMNEDKLIEIVGRLERTGFRCKRVENRYLSGLGYVLAQRN